MFIPEIMTSIGLLICIISANWHKLQRFTSFQFTYDGTWSEEYVSSKNCLINLIFMLPISIKEIVYFTRAQ